MAVSQLHADLIAQAQGKPALVISSIALRALALSSLVRAGEMGAKANLIFPTGHTAVSGRFKSVSVQPNQFQARLNKNGGLLQIIINPEFNIIVELFDPESLLLYSTVDIRTSDLVMPLKAGNNSIKFATPEVVITADVKDAPTRIQAKQASGIGDDDLLRVEGSVGYGGTPSRIVRRAIGELDPIDLEKLFPAFRFGGDLELLELDGSLVIIPEQFEFIGNTGCPKGDATTGIAIIPQQPNISEETVNWPVLARLPKPPEVRKPSLGDGFVAAYMPKPILDLHFGKTAPAITYRDHGNGFIGYDVELSAAIRGVTVSINIAEMALLLKLDFAMWGFTRATIDVPCVGPVELAQAHFSLPKNNGTADVTAIVRLGVDTAGRLLMLPEIEGINLGEAEVTIQLFSKYLGMAGGKAAVVGFLLDAIIGRIIAHNLPWIVFDSIKDAINQHFFVLADMSDFAKVFESKPNVGTWSSDAGSVLMGLAYEG